SRTGITLYPHFAHKIVPGWLDKMLPWRKARGEWLDNVLLISPSREYLERLPMKKLPDRKDFTRFVDDYEGRLKYWRFAMDESARLRDELEGLITRGELVHVIKPLT
ncbi:MAG: patatin-like phospholipase family protein, partial [Burkholderiales bacterium]